MLQGTYTALITPFRDGQVDYDRLAQNIAAQIEAGIDGLVPTGTTGESPTLSHEEHRRVIEHVVEQAAGRVVTIAGTGSNATSEAMELTEHAKNVGADAALLVNPYYNKPTQEGLYRHFMQVADHVDLPLVLYNIPGRTSITMSPETVARLARHAHVVAIKEATGSLDITSEILSLCDIAVVSGDDSLTLPLVSVGGRGVISVLSNLVPKEVKQLTTAALASDFVEARRRHFELFPLFKACRSLATNPIPIKTAMALCGCDTGQMRLPLCAMLADDRAVMGSLLRDYGLL